MAKYILSVDGGGTKTEVLCTTTDGVEVGRGLSGPTNLTSTTVGAASFNLKEAIRQAIEKVELEHEFPLLVMGLAGMDTNNEEAVARKVFTDALGEYQIQELLLVNDSQIALENGTSNPNALVIISGTGSICFGRSETGATAKSGGMDFLLTDQGSGYDIGKQVLGEAIKSFDGRREKSLLEQLVCQHFSVETVDELKAVVYNPTLTKIEVAELSKVCTQAYEQGDTAAREIFERAVAELFLHGIAVQKKLGFALGAFDVVLSGAVMQLEPVKTALTAQFQEQYQVTPICPSERPVFGALKLAQRRLQGT